MQRKFFHVLALLLSCFVTACKKNGGDTPHPTSLFEGGSQVTGLQPIKASPNQPQITNISAGSNLVNPGQRLDGTLDFVDPDGNVANLNIQVEGENVYTKYSVPPEVGRNTKGFIDFSLPTTNNYPVGRYTCNIQLEDFDGNTSDTEKILVIVSRVEHFDIPSYGGSDPPNLSGTWNYQLKILKSDNPDIINTIVNDTVVISQFDDKIIWDQKSRQKNFSGQVTGKGNSFTLTFDFVNEDLELPGIDCRLTASQTFSGQISCNSFSGSGSVIVHLVQGLCSVPLQVTQVTATRVSGGSAFSTDFSKAAYSACNINVTPGAAFEYDSFYGSHWRILRKDGGFVASFNSPQSRIYFLKVKHLTSASAKCKGGGYSPVTITVNNVVLASNYDPAERHMNTHGYIEDRWVVNARAGENRLEWKANDLCTFYWIQRIELTEQ